jgi:Zn finger protein HypA/HybF involved in hydrogenase expression
METAIILAVLIMIGVMFWSIKVSKRLSVFVFSVIFLGIAVAIAIWQGFTEQAFENIGFSALALLLIWFRFSKSVTDTAQARAWLAWRESELSAVCQMCGTKLSYQHVPKNLRFLLLRRFTCPNCGAESKVIFDDATEENAG